MSSLALSCSIEQDKAFLLPYNNENNMFKKILLVLIVVHAILIAGSFYISQQLKAFNWEEASEQTKANKVLKLEGKYRVFAPSFEKGRGLYQRIGQYNWMDSFIGGNAAELNALQTFQLQEESKFEQQYQRQKTALKGEYMEAEYAYIEAQMKNNPSTEENYAPTKTSLKQQFETGGGQLLLQKQDKLDKEMEAFRALFQTTLDVFTK
ncbi:MAG: hypothetical protein ACRBFS_01880 [Aureispira sp.]